MVKKRKAINKGEEDDDDIELSSTVSSRVSSIPRSSESEKVIWVTVNSIENIVLRETLDVTVLVYHDDSPLGESQTVKIEPDFKDPPTKIVVDYLTQLPIFLSDPKSLEAVVSKPLIFKIAECQDTQTTSKPASSEAGSVRKRGKTKSSGKLSGPEERKIIGLCNVDLFPMLLGESVATDRVIVEKPERTLSAGGSSWMNLPILTVTLTQDEQNFFPPDLQVNYLTVTVESIYNIPASFAETLEYKAATIVHTDTEDPETLLFDRGIFSKYRDLTKLKRWRTLRGKYGDRVALSKYKIDCDDKNVKNQLDPKVDLKKLMEEDKPRIEWNCLNRHLLLSSAQQTMTDSINKYKCWPFQFMVSSNTSTDGKTTPKDLKSHFYQCYPDISELLYPGCRQARVVAQLNTYNESMMMERTVFGKLMFDTPVTKEPKEKKGKLKTKPDSSANLITTTELNVEPSYPLVNENDEPVFVVVQFELQEPLVASRTIEELTQDLSELLGPPDRLPPYPYTGDLAEDQYYHCIRKLVSAITDSYRDFKDEENLIDSQSGNLDTPRGKYSYIPDEVDQFTQYLYDTGNYVAIQTTLRNKIILLLDQKFKIRSLSRDSEECQNLVATAYLYLVEQMHVALNSEPGNHFDDKILDAVKAEDTFYYAEENYELGNIEDAKRIYTDLITSRRKDPEAWLRYATFAKRIGDDKRALECCREAIRLDSRNKIALLLHGVILSEKENFQGAETFLKAVTLLYPRFAEGWTVLHLFYHRLEYFQGVDLTIRIAEECLRDEDRDTSGVECLGREPLAWSTIHCPKDRIYLIATVFLLRLNLFTFAGIALGRELALGGRSTPWLYYMAVHHYLLGRYDDALTHLEEAQDQYGLDYSISGLKGHCHFQKGDTESAVECYGFASTLFNRPDDIHLIDLRLGNYFLEKEQYAQAKKIFIRLCKISQTASTWLGLGVASYHMENLTDAESALTEANRLDHKNPEIWAYLCLLNMTLERYDEFTECYRRMVKNNLQKAKVWLLIENTMEYLGLSSPMSLSATSGSPITKESSEENKEGVEDP